MKIIIVGYGQMGQLIAETAARAGDIEVAGVVHPGLFDTPLDVPGEVDAILDFSYPGNLKAVLEYAKKTGCALVLGTTGLSPAQIEDIRRASETSAVIHSSNYSLGIALMKRIVQQMAPVLKDSFDMEIIETHHHNKADAPSGTAKLLLEAIDPTNEYEHVYGRQGMVGKRKKEIGVHAVRGGTVAGEHTVSFFGEDEILSLTHSATSRQIFVNGALRALRFITAQRPGYYTMEDILNWQEDAHER